MRVSLPRLWAAVERRWRAHRTTRRPTCGVHVRALEGLERRWALSTLPAAIQMLSASTNDSKSVTVEYRINQAPDPAAPLQVGIYRWSNGQFDPSDSLVEIVTLSPRTGSFTADASGGAATSLGAHRLTIPLPQGLPPFPEKPFVLAVADPGSSSVHGG